MNRVCPPISFNESTLQAMNLAVQKTFKTMAASDVVMMDHTVKSDVHSLGDVSGVMDLVHPRSGGSIALSFPKETIFYVLNRVYRTDFPGIDDCVQDGVGELLNVIYGQFRLITASLNEGTIPTPPRVMVGNGLKLAGTEPSQTLIVPFRVESHIFHVYLQVNGPVTNGI